MGNTLEWSNVTDIRENERLNFYYRGQIEAIGRTQAVIEFDADMTILDANENFLTTMQYSLDEIIGKDHSIFVDETYKTSEDYKQFRERLQSKENQSGEYRRIAKDGSDIWIRATYNLILDKKGQIDKIVKFATDITDRVVARVERERVGKVMDENLGKIVDSVSDVSNQVSAATSASSETLQTVQSVAAAAEEFQSSANEIARSMDASREQVVNALQEAQSAENSTEQLTSAAQAMTNIVTVIQDIANQINLLALNATIESARAGEAGKGFAVVASEVKSLANQVGSATEQISSEIDNMQTVSGDVVSKLNGIKDAVESVESSVTSVAGAVEEQAATTKEISNSMQAATTAVSNVNASLATITSEVENANGLAMEGTNMYRSINTDTE